MSSKRRSNQRTRRIEKRNCHRRLITNCTMRCVGLGTAHACTACGEPAAPRSVWEVLGGCGEPAAASF